MKEKALSTAGFGPQKKKIVEVEDLLPYLIRPNTIETQMDKIKINETFHQIQMAVGWPRKVPPGFLDRIIKSQGNFDLSMHLEPYPIEVMIVRLQKELEKMNADLQADLARGKMNPALENKIKDTREALDNLMLGSEKMFNLSLYLDAKSPDAHRLTLLSRKLESDLNAINIIPKKPVLRMALALQSMLPLGTDKLKVTRNMPTSALSACFPFTTSFLNIKESGVTMGFNRDNNIPMVIDVFKEPYPNPNGLVLATSGSGKSYLVKLYMIRQILRGVKVLVVDPQNEYADLTEAYGGELINISKNSRSIINPLDLMGQEYDEKLLSLESLFEIMLQPNETQKGILSKAVKATYESKRIFAKDENSWKREPPILSDLERELTRMAKKSKGEDARDVNVLLNRIHRYTEGALAFFNKQTNLRLNKSFVTFNIRDMPDPAKPVAMFLILEYIYKTMKKDVDRKLLIIDEAWSLLSQTSESNYVFKIVKTCRKFNMGLVILTQETKDLLGSKAGDAILANTSWTYLLRQKPAVIDLVVDTFKLSKSEKNMLLTADLGTGVLIANNDHIPIKIIASKREHELVTTNPEEAKRREPETE